MPYYPDILSEAQNPRYAPRPDPLPIPAASWNAEPTFCLSVNDEWVSHLIGALEALDQPDAWAGTESEIDAARQQVNEIMAALMEACMNSQLLVSPQDTTPGYLQDKLLAGDNITLTKNNAGANESLTVASNPALRTARLDFTYLIPNPTLIATLPTGALLKEVNVTIDVPFDGIFVIRVGVPSDNELFMGGADNHAYLQGLYTTEPDYVCLAETQVYLYTVNSGVTQGAGHITLVIQE